MGDAKRKTKTDLINERWFPLLLRGFLCSIGNLLNHFPLPASTAQLYSFRFLKLNPNPNPSMGFAHLHTHALTQTHASRIKYNRPHVLRVEYIIWWLSVHYFTVFGHRFVSFIVTLWRAVAASWDVVCVRFHLCVRIHLSVVQLLATFSLCVLHLLSLNWRCVRVCNIDTCAQIKCSTTAKSRLKLFLALDVFSPTLALFFPLLRLGFVVALMFSIQKWSFDHYNNGHS